MNKQFLAVVSAAVLLLVGVFVVGAIYEEMPANDEVNVEGEGLVVDYDTPQKVDETYGDKYYDDEQVYDSTGTALEEGVDYDWNPETQEVTFNDTAATTVGENATIDYNFDAKPEAARNSIGTIGSAFQLGAVSVIVLVAGLILNLVGGFGSNGRNRGGRR